MSNGDEQNGDGQNGNLMSGLADHWLAASETLEKQRDEVFGAEGQPPSKNAGEWMALMTSFGLEWMKLLMDGARLVASGGKPPPQS